MLNYCKTKELMFRNRNMLCWRLGGANAGQIRRNQLINHMDGYIGYQLTAKIPGSPAYMKSKRIDLTSILYHRGPATFFITLTANSSGWSDLKSYLDEVWKFRDAEAKQPLYSYDISASANFCIQKFRGIRSMICSKNPGFWAKGEFDMCVTSTEFQKRMWPHWHSLFWLNLPWNWADIQRNSPELPEILEFLDAHICTDQQKTRFPEVQQHECRENRCKPQSKRFKLQCSAGFPREPIPK